MKIISAIKKENIIRFVDLNVGDWFVYATTWDGIKGDIEKLDYVAILLAKPKGSLNNYQQCVFRKNFQQLDTIPKSKSQDQYKVVLLNVDVTFEVSLK